MLVFRHGNFRWNLMATIDTTCRNCAAPHARKLSLIYAEGLSTSAGRVDATSTFQTIGRQQIKTTGVTNSTQQTGASKEAAPPEIPELVSHGRTIKTCVMLGGIAGCIVGFFFDAYPLGVAGILALGGSVLISTDPEEEEEEAHKRKHQEAYDELKIWENTFACSSCGHRFIPESIDA